MPLSTFMKFIVIELLTSVLFVAFLAIGAYAQSPAPALPATNQTVFKDLLAKLKAGDANIDYKAFRFASADSDAKEAGKGDRELSNKAIAAFQDGKFKDAIKLADKALDSGYVDSRMHLIRALASEKSGDVKKFEFHKAVYLGLINSILSGADGKSAKTAYVVISIDEESAVLRALELMKGNQSLRNDGGHKYDVLTVTDPKTNKSFELWFNIDIIWKGYEKMFK
jgi:hypothetical protein